MDIINYLLTPITERVIRKLSFEIDDTFPHRL